MFELSEDQGCVDGLNHYNLHNVACSGILQRAEPLWSTLYIPINYQYHPAKCKDHGHVSTARLGIHREEQDLVMLGDKLCLKNTAVHLGLTVLLDSL